MKLVAGISQMQEIALKNKIKGKRIGFVPTMGALHQGHLSLIRAARKDNDIVVVSIFVNPTQFGPKEDFNRYPRPKSQDLELCRQEAVNFVFAPKPEKIYPQGFRTWVTVDSLSELLCGQLRPGHFRGVATIVAKLFNLIQPDIAYFGQKDIQQAVIIKRMASDLNFPVKIKVMPTIRERDGLALSSRNVYLTKPERQSALILSKALKLSLKMIHSKVKDPRKIISAMKRLINNVKGSEINYIEIVDPAELTPVKKVSKGDLIVLAVNIGKTRLIDNLIVN